MKATRTKRVSVRENPHSSTSRWCVSWGTGAKPDKVSVTAWLSLNPDASDEDRKRFMAGNWTRHRKFFRTKAEAHSFALAKEVELSNGNGQALSLSLSLRVMAAEADKKLQPYGYTIAQAVDHFIEHIKATRRSIGVAHLVDEYLLEKKRLGKAERTLTDMRFRLSGFEAYFGAKRDERGDVLDGGRIIEEVRPVEVDDWLRGLDLSPQSVNNYRAVAHAFFAYAIKRNYARENPVSKIDKVKLIDKPAAIFKPAQLAALLEAAGDDVRPVLAIGAFAGLRMAEIFRLHWEEVDLAGGYIEVTARKSKTSQRRLVKIEPNLREWLRPYANNTGPILAASRTKQGKIVSANESLWRERRTPVMRDAKITKWPENGLRHSFGSYHLAHYGDAARLALEMGHTTTKEIFAHYRELVRSEDAARYWAIKPAPAASNVIPMESATA
jgi:integrase